MLLRWPAVVGGLRAWGGIDRVTDAVTSLPITGWTLISVSGFDYTYAVAEPATFALLAIALPSLLLARRRTAGSA